MPEDWDVPLPGMGESASPSSAVPEAYNRAPGAAEWAARVKTAIAVLDAVHSAQKGASVVLVPADALITVQVAAAHAADLAPRLH